MFRSLRPAWRGFRRSRTGQRSCGGGRARHARAGAGGRPARVDSAGARRSRRSCRCGGRRCRSCVAATSRSVERAGRRRGDGVRDRRAMIERLMQHGVFVFVMVGTGRQARRAIAWAPTVSSHRAVEPAGTSPVTRARRRSCREALEVAAGRPVLLQAASRPRRTPCGIGGRGRRCRGGHRFLLTHQSCATRNTSGGSWPPRDDQDDPVRDGVARTHRVVADAATRRWCHDDGEARLVPRIVNAGSGLLPTLPDRAAASVIRLQARLLPLFSPIAPTTGMSDTVVDRAGCTQVEPCRGSPL